jgi:hypothetical protein
MKIVTSLSLVHCQVVVAIERGLDRNPLKVFQKVCTFA